MDRLSMALNGRYTLWDFIQAWNLYIGIGLFSGYWGSSCSWFFCRWLGLPGGPAS